MTAGEIGYLAFGAALVALFAWVVVHSFARSRRTTIEQAKYKMMDDD